jgi:hypothetical protein
MSTIIYVALAAYIAYRLGKRKGEQEMYQLCRNADQVQREFFSRISLN